jgi:hypothetical protein
MKKQKEPAIKPKQIKKNVTVTFVAEPVVQICPKCKCTITGTKNLQKFLEGIKKNIKLNVKPKKIAEKKEPKK